jgi:photosystem II stability/assembly factor-like uncharacterized protein
MCVVWFSLAGCSKHEQQEPETTDLAYYHLHGLWARNAAQVWVVGDDGDILHSTDGGEHWQSQTSGRTIQLSSVYASASQLGLRVWAVGESGTVLHSVDGGERWQSQMSGTTQTLTAICGDGAQLWTVGTDFTILYSGDDGLNWQPIFDTVPVHISIPLLRTISDLIKLRNNIHTIRISAGM